jgi:hypothetical protein
MRSTSAMSRIYFLVGVIAFLATPPAAAQQHYFKSGGTLHGAGSDGVNAIALGANDTIWVVGNTSSTSMNYDLYGSFGGGLFYSGSTSTTSSAFVGLFKPATLYSGMINPISTMGLQRAASTVTDADGNVYIAGRFGDVVSTCQINAAAVGISDLYVISYYPQGGCRWGRSFVGSSQEILGPHSLAIDPQGDLYLTGQFGASSDSVAATFYPEPFLTDPMYTASAAGHSSGFVIKLNSSGGFYGSTQVDGTCANSVSSSAVTTDASGNVYVGFELTGAGHCNGQADELEVIKFDNGLNNRLWTKTISAASQSSLLFNAITASPNGTVAIGGSASAAVNLYSGEFGATHNIGGTPGNSNGFLLRLDTDGNYLASGMIYGAGKSSIDALRFDAAGRLWYSAAFSDNDIDPTTENSHHSVAAVTQDAAIGVIKSDGTFAYANTLKCLSAGCFVNVLSFTPTAYGSLVMGGDFGGQVDLDLGQIATPFTVESDQDAFIVTTLSDGIFENSFD